MKIWARWSTCLVTRPVPSPAMRCSSERLPSRPCLWDQLSLSKFCSFCLFALLAGHLVLFLFWKPFALPVTYRASCPCCKQDNTCCLQKRDCFESRCCQKEQSGQKHYSMQLRFHCHSSNCLVQPGYSFSVLRNTSIVESAPFVHLCCLLWGVLLA